MATPPELFRGRNIPKLNPAVPPAHGHEFSIRRKINGVETPPSAPCGPHIRHLRHPLALFGLPDRDVSVIADQHQSVRVLRELETRYIASVSVLKGSNE